MHCFYSCPCVCRQAFPFTNVNLSGLMLLLITDDCRIGTFLCNCVRKLLSVKSLLHRRITTVFHSHLLINRSTQRTMSLTQLTQSEDKTQSSINQKEFIVIISFRLKNFIWEKYNETLESETSLLKESNVP